MITILIADDQAIIRSGLNAILSLQPGMQVVGEAEDGETAITQCQQLLPDVVLMDLKMPGMGGWRATAAIRKAVPKCRILVFSSLIGDDQVYRAIEAGALGYLMKEAGEEELVSAIRASHAGTRTMPALITDALNRRLATDPITARELEILKLVATGRGNREIGEVLGLTEHTVKGYLKTIIAKLDVPDRTAAVVVALQRGLIDITDIGPAER